jgi:hypothetical protein
MKKRDDFTADTKRKLCERVGGLCSNPTCRTLTSGPAKDPNKRVNIGVASHIVAASGRGPRADCSLTSEQRKAIENGIWLCQNCSKAVDSDESRHSIEQLQQWRIEAESFANAELLSSGPGHRRVETADIHVHSSEWRMWRQRGHDNDDSLVVISLWATAAIRYSCRLRLRSDSPREELLQDARIELCGNGEVLYSDNEWVNDEDIRLPAGQWVTCKIDSGAKHLIDVPAIDEVVFRGTVLGTGVQLRHTITRQCEAHSC